MSLDLLNSIYYESSALQGLSTSKLKRELEKKLNYLTERIERIEQRFAQENTIEKIASINDAILATSVESIKDSITRIEEKQLTKCDVAKIVFTIIGSLGVLIGIIFGIINYVTKA